VPETIEEMALLVINEQNSLNKLLAQRMKSNCIEEGQGAHQMMTSTWFLGA
jgi:hypothetical protein